MAEIQLKRLDKQFVITCRHIGPYETVGDTWATLSEFVRENGLASASTRAIGIVYDDPSRCRPGACRYDACLTIDETAFSSLQARATDDRFPTFDPVHPADQFGQNLNDLFGIGIRLETIEGGDTVTILHRGPHRTLGQSYANLFQATAFATGGTAQDVPPPYYEFYLKNPRFTPASEILTEIHIPIRTAVAQQGGGGGQPGRGGGGGGRPRGGNPKITRPSSPLGGSAPERPT
jgi:AraC family transcriptional regulator